MEQKETTLHKYNKSFFTNAIEASIIALIILVPIIFYPRCITVFLPAKELLAEILVLLALMFWWFGMINREEIKFISTPLNFPILSFISICVLSLIWSNSFFISLKELPLFLAGPLLYFVITNNISDERQISRILNILLLVGGLFGIYGIFQYNGIDFSFWIRNIGRQQVFGLFGNVNYFAEYLIVPLPIAVSLFFVSRNKFKKILLLIGILAMVTSLTVTFTRGSYLGFGASLIFMSFLLIISRGKNFIKKNRKIFIIILAVVIIITFLFIIPTPLNKSGTAIEKIKSRISISQLTQSSSIKRRIATWKFTVLMIKDHPLFGSGLGTYKYNTLKYQAEFFKQGENRSIYPHGFADKAHNEYLQLWAEMGIVGLGIFIWLIISYLNFGLKILRKIKDEYKQGMIIGLMGAVVAVLVDSIFGFPLHLPATVVLFWLALALTVAVSKNKANAEEINIVQKDSIRKIKTEEDRKEKGKAEDNKGNIYRFKPLLYIGIMLLTIFLCVTVVRPFVARTYWYYGSKEIKNGNLNEAIKIYEKGLKWDPYLGFIYYDIGKILQNKEFYGIAGEYLEKASKYIDHPNLPLDFAIIYLKKGILDKAAIKLKQAISYQSDQKSMFPLYAELGNTYLQLKRYKPAEIAFKNALEINPDFINAHYGLAVAYLQQNKQAGALEELQKVIELAPNSREAKYARNIIQKITQEKLKALPAETDNP
jgi:O-antigen ligase/Tfp pilus assembly protein PilF